MDPLPNNTRYLLELERKQLLARRTTFDERYGSFCFFFLETFQTLSMLAYLLLLVFLFVTKNIRSKVNTVVAVWALLNLVVLGDKCAKLLAAFAGDGAIPVDGTPLCQMVAGLARTYAAALAVVWLYTKYLDQPGPRYDLLQYCLMLVPAFVCGYFVFWYYNVDPFVYEAFGPGCDIVSVAAYLLVGTVFALCKIFVAGERDVSAYPLLFALASLICNFPNCLMDVYVRFNLDVSWTYRFHVYFVDFFADLVMASNAFVALFLVFLYHKYFDRRSEAKAKQFDFGE